MQQSVSSLVFQDADTRVLWQMSPWIEARFRGSATEMFQRLAAQTHRRFVKMHLPVDGVPIFDEIQYIHVARDGRDAFMSWHNHHTGFTDYVLASLDQVGLDDAVIAKPFPRASPDPAVHFRYWISTPAVTGQAYGASEGSYFDLEAGYWA
jgi:aryl sulfotransferase